MRLPATLTAVLAALLVAASAAWAHGKLERSTPRAGAVLRTAPAQVKLWFNEKLEPRFSRVEVRDAAGERVDAGTARVDAGSRSVMEAELRQPLPPGTYTVDWHVVSVDTHTTTGRFTFQVKAE